MAKYKPVAQEHPMGCAVACVASLLGKKYKGAINIFDNPVTTKGLYCPQICKALHHAGKEYSYSKLPKDKKYLRKPGTIIFTCKDKKYPEGHYLLKTDKGWMNPWINYPCITPAKAGFCKKVTGKAQWVVFEK